MNSSLHGVSHAVSCVDSSVLHSTSSKSIDTILVTYDECLLFIPPANLRRPRVETIPIDLEVVLFFS
jgi:hypothetical protein